MKKFLLIFLTLAMALSLCACGGGSSETATEENTSTTETTEEETAIWDIDYYVDDFNQPTEDAYIWNTAYFSGTFNNSATTNSQLLVSILVDDVDVAFFLYEYGTHQVKNSSENYVDTYNIKMRTADGTDHNLTGTMYCGDDRIFVDDSYIPEVIAALNQTENSQISFYIENEERTTTNYLFNVFTNNFAEQYETLMK